MMNQEQKQPRKGTGWKDAPTIGAEGKEQEQPQDLQHGLGEAPMVADSTQDPQPRVTISREQAVKDVAMALQVLAQHTNIPPERIEQALLEAQHQVQHQPKPVPLLNADTYKGPLYSARNQLDGSILWAIRLPMMTILTQEHEGQKGLVYGNTGDFLVRIAGKLQIIPAGNFMDIYHWVPHSSLKEGEGLVQQGMDAGQARCDKATLLEQDPSMQAMKDYMQLFLEGWDQPTTCMFQEGRLSIQAPTMPMDAAAVIQPTEGGDQPQYAYTITRYASGYMMWTDIAGSQYPLLQGKVVEVVPKVLECLRKLEGLECYGTFAWSARGADNFVRKYMLHGKDLLTTALKDEWQMAYYLLKKHSEYLAKPELLAQEPKPIPPRKVERRRQPRKKQPTKAQALKMQQEADALKQAEVKVEEGAQK